MNRLDYRSGVSRQRADQALKARDRAPLARIECGGIVVLILASLRSCGE